MTVLWIANSTTQNTAYSFRMGFSDPNHGAPANFRLVTVPCVAGGQVRLLEGDNDEISRIILQLARQGATDVADLDRRQVDLIHSIYSIDTPVKIDKVRNVIVRNNELLNDKAFLARKQLAVATHYKMNERAQEFGPDAPRPNHVIMDIEEVPRVGEDAGNRERIEVVTEGHEPRGQKAGQRKRKAA